MQNTIINDSCKAEISEKHQSNNSLIIKAGNFFKLIDEKAFRISKYLYKENIIHDEFSETKKRHSFINFNRIKLSYISKTHGTIEPYSSSDEDIEEGQRVKNSPSVKDVCENIIDTNTLMIIV